MLRWSKGHRLNHSASRPETKEPGTKLRRFRIGDVGPAIPERNAQLNPHLVSLPRVALTIRSMLRKKDGKSLKRCGAGTVVLKRKNPPGEEVRRV